MGGFLAGSLVLIVLYVAVQPGTAAKAEQGSNVFVAALRRALSPGVAGVPQTRNISPGRAVGAAAAAGAAAGAAAASSAGVGSAVGQAAAGVIGGMGGTSGMGPAPR